MRADINVAGPSFDSYNICQINADFHSLLLFLKIPFSAVGVAFPNFIVQFTTLFVYKNDATYFCSSCFVDILYMHNGVVGTLYINVVPVVLRYSPSLSLYGNEVVSLRISTNIMNLIKFYLRCEFAVCPK